MYPTPYSITKYRYATKLERRINNNLKLSNLWTNIFESNIKKSNMAPSWNYGYEKDQLDAITTLNTNTAGYKYPNQLNFRKCIFSIVLLINNSKWILKMGYFHCLRCFSLTLSNNVWENLQINLVFSKFLYHLYFYIYKSYILIFFICFLGLMHYE